MTKLLYSSIKTIQLSLLSSLLMTTPLLHAQKHAHADAAQDVSGTLLQEVRQGTKQFVNVNNATAAGYGPFLGCVTGPDHGAMGIHYVNGDVLGVNGLNPALPTALIMNRKATARCGSSAWSSLSTPQLGWRTTTTRRRSSRGRSSTMWERRTASTSIRSSSCMSGPGATTRRDRTSTGTIT